MYKKMIKRRIVSIVAAMVFLIAISGCGHDEEGSVYMNIGPKEAKKLMDELDEYVLLDARSEEEFSEGHIPGAIVIPHDEISERAESEISEKDIPVFVYCRSGRRSKLAAEALLELGYEKIYEFGGINSWPYEIEN